MNMPSACPRDELAIYYPFFHRHFLFWRILFRICQWQIPTEEFIRLAVGWVSGNIILDSFVRFLVSYNMIIKPGLPFKFFITIFHTPFCYGALILIYNYRNRAGNSLAILARFCFDISIIYNFQDAVNMVRHHNGSSNICVKSFTQIVMKYAFADE